MRCLEQIRQLNDKLSTETQRLQQVVEIKDGLSTKLSDGKFTVFVSILIVANDRIEHLSEQYAEAAKSIGSMKAIQSEQESVIRTLEVTIDALNNNLELNREENERGTKLTTELQDAICQLQNQLETKNNTMAQQQDQLSLVQTDLTTQLALVDELKASLQTLQTELERQVCPLSFSSKLTAVTIHETTAC